ncbi:MAG: glycosyltransferase [Peptostreptococcaceae bacterium]
MPFENIIIDTKIERIEKNKYRFSLNVKPYNRDYEYAWYIYKGEERVDTIWYSRKSKIEYIFSNIDEYKVKYFIKDRYGHKKSGYFKEFKEIDNNNTILEIKKEEIRIDKYIRKINKNKYRFSLDVHPRGNYEYAWYIYKDGEKIDTIWYSKCPHIEYTMEEEKEKYRIKYFIKNRDDKKSGYFEEFKEIDKDNNILEIKKEEIKKEEIKKEEIRIDKCIRKINKNKYRFSLDVHPIGSYEYAWYIYKDGEKIDTIWYSKCPHIEYSMEEEEKYKIKYFIKDRDDKKTVGYFDELRKIIPQNNNDIENLFYPNLKIATILDEISYECFKYDCKLLRVSKENFKNEISEFKPDFLFVESAWDGNQENWKGIIVNTKEEIKELVKYCKSNNIITVFWCKEDSPKYYDFINTAKLFDYVFTTDENCIPLYKKDLSNNNIYPLMFGIQPKIHNPIKLPKKEILNRVCFAGIYYSDRFKERKESFDMFATESLKYGLDIYDRFSYVKEDNRYKYPEKFKDSIKSYVKYWDLIKLYKKYDVVINLNTVTDSETMFSRRIFDCLACGTPIITNYSKGVEKYFSDVVGICKTEEETRTFLDKILNNEIYKDKLKVNGINKVIKENKYSDRLKYICDIIGINLKYENEKKVSVIVCTNRQENMDKLFDNYIKQTQKHKELIIVLNGDDMSLAKWQLKANQYLDEDIKVFKLSSEIPLGKCLNFGIKKSKYDYICKMDDDDCYSKDCLKNELIYFDYTDASIIGKNCFYVYFKDTKKLAIKFENRDYIYTNLVAGSCMLFTREVYKDVGFNDELNVYEIADFLRKAIEKGYKIFSTSKFDHAVIRGSDLSKHTWRVDEEEYLTRCKLLKENVEYEELEKLIDLNFNQSDY